MASKQRADRQKEKEKKEKIILVVLVAIMIVVGAIELPSILSKKSGSPSTLASSTAQTTTTSSAANPSGTPSPGSGPVESLPNASGYTPNPGQLSGFSLFNSRDPFGSVTTSSTTTSSTTTTTSKTTTTTPQTAYVAARVSVNNVSQDVLLNATFPSDSRVFVLDSVSAKKIEISVAGGSFSSGQSKVAIAKGKSVVLENTVDSTRYEIKFVSALKVTPTTGGATTGGATTGGATTGGATTGGATTSSLTVTTS